MLSARRVRLIVCTCELSKHRGFDERTGLGLDQIVRRLRERSRTWHCLMQSFIPLRGLLVGNQAASILLWLQLLDLPTAVIGEAAKLDAQFMEGPEKAL